MLTQRNIRTGVVMLAFAFAATSPLLFVTGNWTAMVASAQAPLEQRQLSSIPVEGKYVTRLFNLTGKQLAQFEGRVLGFSSNGQQLLTKISPTMGRYHLFDISGKELLNFEGRTAEFTPDGQHIITMLKDKDYFQLYDVSGNKLAQLPGTVLKSPIFSRNGQRLVTFTEDSAYLFDASGRQIGRMPGQFRGFGGGFDSTGQRLILYRDNPTSCTLFDSSGSKIAQLPRECAGISPNSKRFLTGVGSWDFPSTHLYDFSGKKIAELSGAIALFNPDETIILTTDFFTGNSSSYLYTSTGKRIANLKGTNGKFSSNGKRFVTIAGLVVQKTPSCLNMRMKRL